MRVSLNMMPAAQREHTLTFPRLDGGLNLRDDETNLKPNESPDMLNLWWEDGALRTRPGEKSFWANAAIHGSAPWSARHTRRWGSASAS